ncbi:MAG: hypothetical protein AAFO57_00235 [Pseudomonadota bacterium]
MTTKEALEQACDVLPEGVNWGDALMPWIVEHIISALRAHADAGPVAWMHEEDASRVISAVQKAQAVKDGGASASSVRAYSVPLTHPSLPAAQGLSDAKRYAEWRHLTERGQWSDGVPAWARDHEGRMNDVTAMRAVIEELASILSRSATVAEPSEELVADLYEQISELRVAVQYWSDIAKAKHTHMPAAQQQAEPVGDERAVWHRTQFTYPTERDFERGVVVAFRGTGNDHWFIRDVYQWTFAMCRFGSLPELWAHADALLPKVGQR